MFSVGPFNKARYERLLKGLEVSVLSFSEVKSSSVSFRCDGQYFQKEFLDFKFKSDTLRLGDLCEVRSGTTPPDRDDELQSGVVLLKTNDIRNSVLSSIDAHSFYHVSEVIASRMCETELHPHDVLLNIVGATTDVIGRVAFVPDGFPRSNITQAMALLRGHDARLVPEFLFVFLAGKYGQIQVRRNARPTGQYNLNLPEVRAFQIPFVSREFQEHIGASLRTIDGLIHDAHVQSIRAEQTLLSELGLSGWSPPEPLTYQRRASEVFAVGRYDSQYHAPRVQQLITRLRLQGMTIGDVAPERREAFAPQSGRPFDYIEISDLTGQGETGGSQLDGSHPPDRTKWIVHAGDVITSTVRPVRRLSALIQPEQEGFVCSSGFVVLNPTLVPAELLLVYLRLSVICELMDLHTTASMYPAISNADLLSLPFVKPGDKATAAIVKAVKAAREAREKARRLLDAAKRAVEVAIEENEAAGMKVLRDAQKS